VTGQHKTTTRRPRPPIMLRTLRRIFGAVIAILSPETDLFDAYRQTSYHPDLPWSELADQFRSLSIDATRHETARPAIAGTRITWDWLKSIGRRECLYRFRCVSVVITHVLYLTFSITASSRRKSMTSPLRWVSQRQSRQRVILFLPASKPSAFFWLDSGLQAIYSSCR
jgi:hypothetical protein